MPDNQVQLGENMLWILLLSKYNLRCTTYYNSRLFGYGFIILTVTSLRQLLISYPSGIMFTTHLNVSDQQTLDSEVRVSAIVCDQNSHFESIPEASVQMFLIQFPQSRHNIIVTRSLKFASKPESTHFPGRIPSPLHFLLFRLDFPHYEAACHQSLMINGCKHTRSGGELHWNESR